MFHHACCFVLGAGLYTILGAPNLKATQIITRYTDGVGKDSCLAPCFSKCSTMPLQLLLIGIFGTITAFSMDISHYVLQVLGIGCEHDNKDQSTQHLRRNDMTEMKAGKLEAGMREIPSSYKMIDIDSGNNLMIALDIGGYLFSKEGTQYLVAGNGQDNFFFSMCTTKIIDNQISVISNFEDHKDKVYLFCTKIPVFASDIYSYFDASQNLTIVEIHSAKFGDTTTTVTDHTATLRSAIGIFGNHPQIIDDIITGQKWDDVVSKAEDREVLTTGDVADNNHCSCEHH